MKLIFALVLTAASFGSLGQAASFTPAPSSNPFARIPQTQAEADEMHGIKPIPPLPAPPGMVSPQLDAWNFLTSRPGFKSIEIVKLDPSLVANGSFTLKLKGKTYVFEGKTERKVYAAYQRNPVTGKREEAMSPGSTNWYGTNGGANTGSLHFLDDGFVNGSFAIIGAGNFNVITKGGLTFLVEHDYVAEGAAKRAAAEARAAAASGVQK